MRIKIIDGFRTIAVLGVLWSHCWMFLGNPPLKIYGLGIGGILSFFGTGVDLFFVISGFCMYLMYISKQNHFSYSTYFNYIKKRFVRIAPAFYAAIFIYGLVTAGFSLRNINWSYSLISATFIRTLFTVKTAFAPHFWSLATEWHFYLLLPMLVFLSQQFGFKKMIILVFVSSILFRIFFWYNNDDPFNIINYAIPNRIIEFLFGIIIAKIHLEHSEKWYFNSNLSLVGGILVAFTGRLLMSSAFQENIHFIGFISRVINLPLLTFGYALVIINTLNVTSFFSKIIESRFMTFIGKYSYSMYLWHWIIAEHITNYFSKKMLINDLSMLLFCFVISTIILIPISMLSYYLFESFYFKKRHDLKAA
jgi:peptidoglycan/LPS O-acetylase OafA/YrhL